MERGRFGGRRTGMAAAAALLAFGLASAWGGCGKKEGPAPQGTAPQGTTTAVGEAAAPAAGRAGAPPAGGGGISVPAGRNVMVVVAPSSPSRISPPSVSIQSPPGGGAELLDVRWLVNGEEREGGRVLAPSGFRRGDRIRAAVILRAGGEEKLLTTPEVIAVNALPAVSEVRIEPQPIITGSTVRAVVQAGDPDGDPLTFKFRWYVDNAAVPGESDSLTLKDVKKGSWIHAAATPNDGFADGAWKYSPRIQVVNAPPAVKSKAPTTIPPSRVLTHAIVAEDPDGDPLTFTLVKGPEGMALSGATLTWKVSDRDLGRTAEVVIRISDDDGASTMLTMILNPRKP